MKGSKNQNGIWLYSIRQKVRCARNHQLSRALDAAHSSDAGMIGTVADGDLDRVTKTDRRPRITLRDISTLLVTILPRERQPCGLHP